MYSTPAGQESEEGQIAGHSIQRIRSILLANAPKMSEEDITVIISWLKEGNDEIQRGKFLLMSAVQIAQQDDETQAQQLESILGYLQCSTFSELLEILPPAVDEAITRGYESSGKQVVYQDFRNFSRFLPDEEEDDEEETGQEGDYPLPEGVDLLPPRAKVKSPPPLHTFWTTAAWSPSSGLVQCPIPYGNQGFHPIFRTRSSSGDTRVALCVFGKGTYIRALAIRGPQLATGSLLAREP